VELPAFVAQATLKRLDDRRKDTTKKREKRNDATHLVSLLIHRELLLGNDVLQRDVDGLGSDEGSRFEDVGGESDGRRGGDLDFEDVGSGFDVGEEGGRGEEVEFEGDEIGVHACEG